MSLLPVTVNFPLVHSCKSHKSSKIGLHLESGFCMFTFSLAPVNRKVPVFPPLVHCIACETSVPLKKSECPHLSQNLPVKWKLSHFGHCAAWSCGFIIFVCPVFGLMSHLRTSNRLKFLVRRMRRHAFVLYRFAALYLCVSCGKFTLDPCAHNFVGLYLCGF